MGGSDRRMWLGEGQQVERVNLELYSSTRTAYLLAPPPPTLVSRAVSNRLEEVREESLLDFFSRTR